MTKNEITQFWKQATELASNIWFAYVTGEKIEQAKQDQERLKEQLDLVKEKRLVYNGSLDEFVILKF